MTNIPPPRKLRIEIGRDCALRCVHCSAYATTGHPLVMPLDLARRLVREFAEMGGREVTFTGGEPFVNPNLPVMLSDAKAMGLQTVVFTSGIVHEGTGRMALPRAYLEHAADLIGCAVFSIYSVDPSTHDAITYFPGSLDLTREAVCRTISVGIPSELHFVPTRINFHGLLALVQDARELGVRAVRVIRYVPQGRGAMNNDLLRLGLDEQLELRLILREALGISGVQVHVGSGFGYLLEEAPECTAALDELVVGADGRIHPCSGFADFNGQGATGNVFEAPLATVWRDAPYLQRVRFLLARRQSTGPGCRSGCLAQKSGNNGQITDSVPDPDEGLLFASSVVKPATESNPARCT